LSTEIVVERRDSSPCSGNWKRDGWLVANETNARIVIIGGGVIGLGIAYHLAKLGVDDVLLIERNQLTSGTSWHAAGIVGPLRASMNLTRLAAYATELLPKLEAETGQATGYRQTGGYWLARNNDRMIELNRIAAMGEMAGLEARIVTPGEIADQAPFLRCDDLADGLWVAGDGQASPVDICMAYAKGARTGGVRIREGAGCIGIDTKNGAVSAVRLSTGETVRCAAVVNCAGAWARQIGAMAGVPVPLQAVEHMYVVTEPMPELPQPLPVIRDLEGGIYIKGDAGKVVLGGFEPFAKVWDPLGADGDRAFLELPEDWGQFEPFMEAGLNRLPGLAKAGIQHFMNGPESFTPDSRQLMGESPYLKGFFVAAGMNSIGMMSSAGVGKAMAEWIVAGEPPMDLWEVDIARFDRAAAIKGFLVSRMDEAVANQLDMHWPFKQMRTGRGVCRSALHDGFTEAGAVFGAPTGWERPLWFAHSEAERAFRYSYDAQCWWDAAARESQAVRDGVALFELSPFTKLDLGGRDALALLQQLCANEIDVAVGRAVYTQMLNRHGGIEADVTVTRIAESEFRIVSGAATRAKDIAWITRQRDRLGLEASVFDATSAEAVLGVMGPGSRALLQGHSPLLPRAELLSGWPRCGLPVSVLSVNWAGSCISRSSSPPMFTRR
jgi:4-methylaminobutanoate oxidase (formaldehyde-forming)